MSDNAPTTEQQLDTPIPVTMTPEQQQAVKNTYQSACRLKREYDNYLKLYAGLTGDAELIASVGLLGALLADLRERCRVLEVGNDK